LLRGDLGLSVFLVSDRKELEGGVLIISRVFVCRSPDLPRQNIANLEATSSCDNAVASVYKEILEIQGLRRGTEEVQRSRGDHLAVVCGVSSQNI
jgi:hypothetical protein